VDTGLIQSIEQASAEIPRPPGPVPGPPAAPPAPTVHVSVSQAGAWVADLRKTIRDFGDEPLVRVSLTDGEQVFLQALAAGPGDEFVTLYVHRAEERMAPVLVVRLAAISKLELLREPPGEREAAFRFDLRKSK
jgi:hypothetical protein